MSLSVPVAGPLPEPLRYTTTPPAPAPLPIYNTSSLSPTFKQIKIDSPPDSVQAAYLPPDLACLPALADARLHVHPRPYAGQAFQSQLSQQAQQVHPRQRESSERPTHHRFPSSGQQLKIDTFRPTPAPYRQQPEAVPALVHQSSLKARRHSRSYSTSHLAHHAHSSHAYPLPSTRTRPTGADNTNHPKKTPAAKLTGSRFEPRTPGGSRQCTNCAETSTPQWRGLLCNACALWKRARGQDRPVPLKFGGKKVLPPGSRERVKKATSGSAHPQPVFGMVGARLEYQHWKQQQQQRKQPQGDEIEEMRESGSSVRQREYNGPVGVKPFTLAMPPKKDVVSTGLMPEHRHFDFPSRASLVEEREPELLIGTAPTHTDDPGTGIRLPPIGPLLAACPLDPIKVQQHHSRSSSVDHTSLVRWSLSPEPTPASAAASASASGTASASAASAAVDSEQRITLPFPVPSTFSRRPSNSHTHLRAASESWDMPGALPSMFGARAERDVFIHSTGTGLGRGQGHMRHASDSLSAILSRRDSIHAN